MNPRADRQQAIARHDLLASALARRRMRVCVAEDHARFAYAAGPSIMLPRQAPADDPLGFLGVVAQAMLVAAGSLEPAVLRRLIGRPAAARRYALLELTRAIRSGGAIVPMALKRHLPSLATTTMTQTAQDSATIALLDTAVPTIPAFIGTVRPLQALRAVAAEDGFAAAAGRLRMRRAAPARDDDAEPSEETRHETSVLLKLLQNPLAAGNALADLLDRLIGARRQSGGTEPQAGGGAELAIGRVERAWRRGLHAVRSTLALHLPAAVAAAAETSDLRLPEWDVQQGRMRPGWVHLQEVDAWRAGGPRDLAGLLTRPSATLLRSFAPLGLSYAMQRRQREGSDLDAGRLAEYAIQLRLGEAEPAPDVYRSSRRTRRELGVVVMLDLSASTGERNPEGRSVFDQQLQVGCHLVECLDRLGCSVAFHGFHSWGRHAVRVVRLKGHQEPWSGRVAERCALLEPIGYTRTGAAVRYADFQLREEMRLATRLLVLISDGFVYDEGYEGSYAEADTRMALSRARDADTACVCICVGGSTSVENLGKVFGKTNFLVVDRADQVARRIAPLCRDALARRRRGSDVRK